MYDRKWNLSSMGKKDTSAEVFYSITNQLDLKIVNRDEYNLGDRRSQIYPEGASILNVRYYAENHCGATLKIGSFLKPVSAECGFFLANKNFVLENGTLETEAQEQWVYLRCEEKDEKGNHIKAFIEDKDFLSQPGVKNGCFGSYGVVSSCK